MAVPRAFMRPGLTAVLVACLTKATTGIAVECVPWNQQLRESPSGGPVIGYNPDSRPFSFVDEAGRPAGFSVDICKRVAERFAHSSEPMLAPITSVDRFEKLESGEVDMLCSAVTHTLQRRERMQFSTTIFVTGAEMVSKRGSNIRDLEDLVGKSVGVLENTTTEAGLRSALRGHDIQIRGELHLVRSHGEGMQNVLNDRFDAYFGDRVLLQAYVQSYPQLRFSGRLYSFEPYAIAVRMCDQHLLHKIDWEIAELFRSGEIWDLYKCYFPNQEPSHLLIATFILGGLPPGGNSASLVPGSNSREIENWDCLQ